MGLVFAGLGFGYLMSFFRILLPEKKNALRLRISRVSQLHKIPENLQGELFGRILAKAGKSANSESTFNSTKLLRQAPKKSYHLGLGWGLRWSGSGGLEELGKQGGIWGALGVSWWVGLWGVSRGFWGRDFFEWFVRGFAGGGNNLVFL